MELPEPIVWWITTSRLLVKGRWSHLNTWVLVDIWQTSETSHTKSSLENFSIQYLAKMLVNAYSRRLMVKSVSCCYDLTVVLKFLSVTSDDNNPRAPSLVKFENIWMRTTLSFEVAHSPVNMLSQSSSLSSMQPGNNKALYANTFEEPNSIV